VILYSQREGEKTKKITALPRKRYKMTYNEIFNKAVSAIENLNCNPYYFDLQTMTDKVAIFDLREMDDTYDNDPCDTKYDAIHMAQDTVLEMMTDEQADSNYFEGGGSARTEEIEIETYKIIINL
jgi:hypothetical protein